MRKRKRRAVLGLLQLTHPRKWHALELMDVCRLSSASIYPILAGLEHEGLLDWGKDDTARTWYCAKEAG